MIVFIVLDFNNLMNSEHKQISIIVIHVRIKAFGVFRKYHIFGMSKNL